MSSTSTKMIRLADGVDYELPFVDLLPALSSDEYAALKANIERFGIVVPIVARRFEDVTGDWRVVLDGGHRLRIAQELGLSSEDVPVKWLKAEEDSHDHAMDLNLLRRHLSAETRAHLSASMSAQGHSNRAIAKRL